jgi:uncharacterized protein Veg
MKKIALLVMCVLVSISLYAQENVEKGDTTQRRSALVSASSYGGNLLPQFSPLTPNAASLQKFGDFQVNLATGIPDIAIPLFTVQEGNLSMPITLKYHAAGFKVHEHSSWVGLGWALDLGASMNRTVQGLADEGTSGYSTSAITLTRDFCNNGTDFLYGSAVSGNTQDAQPDIFSYSTPQRSGKFILGFLGAEIFKIPDYPVQIKRSISSNQIQDVTLIDDTGIEYKFGEKEIQNVTVSGLAKIYPGSWLITQINSPNSDDRITYSYQDGGYMSYSENTWTTAFTFNASPTGSTGYYQNTTVSIPEQSNMNSTNYQRNPHKIIFTNGEVEFVQSNSGERLDQTGSRFLKQINVYNYEGGLKKLIKKIKFTYGYFTYGSANSRLKLLSVTVTDELETTSEMYNFDYWTNTIAWNTSPDVYGIDFFGYFNGAANNHLIPVASHGGVPVSGGAANRSTVTTYMKNAVLMKITYPTKAFTEFDYETNKYKSGGVEKYAGGLRIKSIKSTTGSKTLLKRYEYSSADGDGVGRLTTSWTTTDALQPLLQKRVYYSPCPAGCPYTDSQADLATYVQDGANVSITSMDASPIYYTKVTEYFEESTDALKNGKNIYTFDFRNDLIVNSISYATRDVKPWLRGNLLTKAVYNKDNVLVAADTNVYQEMATSSRLAAAFVTNPTVFDNGTRPTILCTQDFDPAFPVYRYLPVTYHSGINLPVQKRMTDYSATRLESTTYLSNLLVDKRETLGSRAGEKITEQYVYPHQLASNSPINRAWNMKNRNMLNIPLQTNVSHTLSSTTSIFKKQVVYDSLATGVNARGLAGNVVIKEIWSAPDGGTLYRRVNFTDYATNGNPLAYYLEDKKISVALIWGYNSSVLIGELNNVTKAEAEAAMSTAGMTAAGMSVPAFTSTETTKIRSLQALFPYGMITWYTHRPHVGISGIVSPQGTLNSYTYDGLLRLRTMKDNSGNITDLYRYNLATVNP